MIHPSTYLLKHVAIESQVVDQVRRGKGWEGAGG